MAGATGLGRTAKPVGSLLRVGRNTSGHVVKRPGRIDQSAPLGDITGIEKTRDRNGHEAGIGEVKRTVGKSEPLGLDDEMSGTRLKRRGTEIETLKGKINRLSHLTLYSTITVSTKKKGGKPGPVGWLFTSAFNGLKWLF